MTERIVMEVPCGGEQHRIAVRECEEGPGIEFVVLDHDATTLAAFTTFGARPPICVDVWTALDRVLDAYIKASVMHSSEETKHITLRSWVSKTAFTDAVVAGERGFQHLKRGDWIAAQRDFSVAAAIEHRFSSMLWWNQVNDALIEVAWVRRFADEAD
jgi:hypothetical protein